MADLRSRFIEDYAGGLLNIARQELSTTGEVLAQDGLTSEGTLFVEDGSGNKSGLKLGVGIAEVIDPTSDMGIVNVRFADRTYAKVRDLKIFSTAIASAQAALSEASSLSITNLETTLQLLEDDITTLQQNFQTNLVEGQAQLQEISLTQKSQEDKFTELEANLGSLSNRVELLEIPVPDPRTISDLSTDINLIYYTGTISITAGVVTGTNSFFDEQLDVGDVFVATGADGLEREFMIASFDTVNPGTKMYVVPTNVDVNSETPFSRPLNRDLKRKINEILDLLRELKFII